MLEYVWLIAAFPLLGVVGNIFLGGKLGRRFVSFLSCGVVGLSFAASVATLVSLLSLDPSARHVEKQIFTWFLSGGFRVEGTLLIDPLSVLMVLVVSGVSFLIHVYSTGYMAGDEGYRRYFVYLNLFTFSMLLLVLAGNFLLLYVGWEAVGLCSYLLIGFWFQRKAAADAGRKAFIVNRIGDFGFALGVLLIFRTFGTLDFSGVFSSAGRFFPVGSPVITAITLLLFMGATGKSAQIPLYTWLPDAMEGPTPVSALIHAATMVTAGVYMVARTSPLFLLSPVSMAVVAAIGVATALYAASIGLVQNDMKRILAYSTISQLGYMFLACGVGAFATGIFHLMTHAFFKALLFLVAGAVIHALSGEQDITKMGGLRAKLPVSYWTFLIAALAIAGIFPFSGFFSKDEILWETLRSRGVLLWALGAAGSLMTAFYMFRLTFLVFHGKPRHEKSLHAVPASMNVPLVCLAVLSAVAGLVGAPLLFGRHVVKEFLDPVFNVQVRTLVSGHTAVAADGGSLSELAMAVVSLSVAVLGIAVAYRFYVTSPEAPLQIKQRFARLYSVLFNKYYVDEIYAVLFVRPLTKLASILWNIFDSLIIDGAVNGSASAVDAGSRILRRIQTGAIQSYALSIALGAIAVLAFWLLR